MLCGLGCGLDVCLPNNQEDRPFPEFGLFSSGWITSGFSVIQDQPRTEHVSEMGTSRQHGFVKRYRLGSRRPP